MAKINIKRIGKLIIFYFIFYAVLAAFFSVLMVVLLSTLDDNAPKWQLDNSLIGSNPALNLHPMPGDFYEDTILISYNESDKFSVQYWQKKLDTFLEGYPQTNFGLCGKNNGYGYGPGKKGPCIFLKLNKIYGWIPHVYNSANLPNNMPVYLKQRIASEEKKGHNGVWVDCYSKNPNNVNQFDAIDYYPFSGFEGKYFPFSNSKDYRSPLVAVYFQYPTAGVRINVECKAWAHNIHHDRANQKGIIQFQFLIEKMLL